MNMSDSVEELNIDAGLDLEELENGMASELNTQAESLKHSMDSILNKIKFAVQNDDEDLKSVKEDISKISSNSEADESLEMNSEILQIINNKLDVLIDAKDEQNLMLKKISEDIDDMLIKIDKSADLIMANFENQNARFDNLLELLQDILEGIQEIKGLLSDMNMKNMTKASNVVDNLKTKIDSYMNSDDEGIAGY
ncbi:phage infection protein [Methanococcus voltae]|uniref:Vacuolar-type H+-ATPase subunit I/STV1 n=1 Tax=Methanococcus voltae PS TaxID=523842 RepID=A0ABT2EUX4_METVO|nr:phage infection protein [Methanococcus voltae]MBP2172011.1 vacuolar-type H+-ATPase subunit I/STV1 [Methanococcus voltae]MCS3921756.1 vacuolar-type H+-ATPase subunit I/STV1 [Methanococcus voltae PS]